MKDKAKILIIDDEESIRYTFSGFLREEGYDVVTAGGYEQGLAELDQNDFDLVFTDIILGGKTGLDLLREIHERKLRCEVVVFTGIPTRESEADAYRLGAFDYLVKPVLLDGLLRVTRAALLRRQREG